MDKQERKEWIEKKLKEIPGFQQMYDILGKVGIGLFIIMSDLVEEKNDEIIKIETTNVEEQMFEITTLLGHKFPLTPKRVIQ